MLCPGIPNSRFTTCCALPDACITSSPSAPNCNSVATGVGALYCSAVCACSCALRSASFLALRSASSLALRSASSLAFCSSWRFCSARVLLSANLIFVLTRATSTELVRVTSLNTVSLMTSGIDVSIVRTTTDACASETISAPEPIMVARATPHRKCVCFRVICVVTPPVIIFHVLDVGDFSPTYRHGCFAHCLRAL